MGREALEGKYWTGEVSWHLVLFVSLGVWRLESGVWGLGIVVLTPTPTLALVAGCALSEQAGGWDICIHR